MDACIGKGSLDVKDIAQQERRQAHREQVQRYARQELIGMESHCKQNEDSSYDQRPGYRAQNAKEPAVQEERPENSTERTDQHHSFHGNVEDTGIEGECPTNSRKQDRGGSDEHGRDKPEQDIH